MDQVEEVKAKSDIVSVISEHIELKKAGRNYKALCPFHSEKTPSFVVSPELQIFKCFGCNEAGDVYAFLQKYEGMDFYESLKFLAERAGVKLKATRPGQRSEKEKLYQINTLASHFYSYLLLKHSVGRPALSYLLKNRGLKLETVRKFQLGYSPDKPLALKSFLIDKKKINLQDLAKAGIVYIKNGRGVDRFTGRIIFPLFDHRGNVVGFAGRTIPGRSSSKLAKYINTPETPIYHKSNVLYGLEITRKQIKDKGFAVVVEGELDMISSWQIGIKNTVALKGSALTNEQAKLLARFSKNVVLALDADVAGDAAARRGIEIAELEGLEVKVADLGDYKDPDDMARKDPDLLKKSVKKAVGVWDFLINLVFSKYDSKTGSGKAKISREVVPILSSIADHIVQAHYINRVARKLDVSEDVVSQQVTKTKSVKKVTAKEVFKTQKPKTRSRRELLEERLLAVVFRSDSKEMLKKDTLSLITTPFAKRIATEYRNLSASKRKKFDPSLFAAKLPGELVAGFSDLIIKDIRGIQSDDPKVYKKELALIKRELGILDIKEKLKLMAKKISEHESKKDKKKLQKAKMDFSKLTNKLSKLEEENNRGIIL
jgi:DNA primase